MADPGWHQSLYGNSGTASFVTARHRVSNCLGRSIFWSIIFFNLQNFGFALIWLIILWLLILWMIFSFRKVDSLAAWLQIPYLLWVTFAAYLNFGVWILN